MGLATVSVEQVMFPLAPGELSEKAHARATTLLADVNEATESGDRRGDV